MKSSYHGDVSTRTMVLHRIQKHMSDGTIGRDIELDEDDLTVGLVGCFGWDHEDANIDHSAAYHVAERVGLPSWVVMLGDEIHNELPDEQRKTWPLRLAEAIAADVNLDRVPLEVGSWIFNDPTYGLATEEDVQTARGRVAEMYRNGPATTLKQWMDIRNDPAIDDDLAYYGASAAMRPAMIAALAEIGRRLTAHDSALWITSLSEFLLDRLRSISKTTSA